GDVRVVRRVSRDEIDTPLREPLHAETRCAEKGRALALELPRRRDEARLDLLARCPCDPLRAPASHCLERRLAVALRARVLRREVTPAAGADERNADERRFALDAMNRVAVNRENVEYFQGRRVVAADEVLIADEVGVDGRKRPLQLLGLFGDALGEEVEAEKLALVVELGEAAVAPAQQSVRLVTRRNRIVRPVG